MLCGERTGIWFSLWNNSIVASLRKFADVSSTNLFSGKQYDERAYCFFLIPLALTGARGTNGASAPPLFDILLTAIVCFLLIYFV